MIGRWRWYQAQRQRRWELIEELSSQARVEMSVEGETLRVTAHNRPGVVALNVLAIWLGLEPPSIAVGDTVSIDRGPAPRRNDWGGTREVDQDIINDMREALAKRTEKD